MKIDHLTYYGGTVEEAKYFYGHVLGFKTKEVSGKIWVRIGDEYTIHLTNNSNMKTGGTCHFAIGVDDVSDRANEALERGAKLFDFLGDQEVAIAKIESGIKQFFVRDPGGNLVEFIKIEG